MKVFLRLLCFLSAACFSVIAADLDAIRYPNFLPYVGWLAKSGDVLFSAGQAELGAFDVSDPANPVKLGALPLSGAKGLLTSGSLGYIPLGAPGLRIVDLTNPAQLTTTSTYRPQYYADDVALSGNYAFVANFTNIDIVNISNATSPQKEGVVTGLTPPFHLTAESNVLFVADLQRLSIFDIANPTNPISKGVYQSKYPAYSRRVTVSKGRAFLTSLRKLEVLNVADPSAPQYVTELELCGNTAVFGDLLFASDAGYPLTKIYDISNLSAPDRIGGCEVNQSVLLSGSNVFGGYRIFKLQPSAFPRVRTMPYSWIYAERSGLVSYIRGDKAGTIVQVDFSTPGSPQVIREFSLPGTNFIRWAGNDKILCGITAPPAGNPLMFVFDTNDPSKPLGVFGSTSYDGSVDPGTPHNVALKDSLAFVTTEFGVMALDLSNPAAPKEIGRFRDSQAPSFDRIVLENNTAYVLTTSSPLYGETGVRFSILNIANPAAIQRYSAHEILGRRGLTIKDGRAYVAGFDLNIFDVRDPANVTLIGASNQRGYSAADDPVVLSDFAYVAKLDGVFVYDIRDPAAPKMIARNYSVSPSEIWPLGSKRIHMIGTDGLMRFFNAFPNVYVGADASPFTLLAVGPFGIRGSIQKSPDLSTWTNWQIITFGSEISELPDAEPSGVQFYRFILE